MRNVPYNKVIIYLLLCMPTMWSVQQQFWYLAVVLVVPNVLIHFRSTFLKFHPNTIRTMAGFRMVFRCKTLENNIVLPCIKQIGRKYLLGGWLLTYFTTFPKHMESQISQPPGTFENCLKIPTPTWLKTFENVRCQTRKIRKAFKLRNGQINKPVLQKVL